MCFLCVSDLLLCDIGHVIASPRSKVRACVGPWGWIPEDRTRNAKARASFKKCTFQRSEITCGMHAVLSIIPWRRYQLDFTLKSAGTAPPCLVSSALSDLGTDDESNDDVDAVKHVAGGIFGGEEHSPSFLLCFERRLFNPQLVSEL
jgi:hypothetical protein